MPCNGAPRGLNRADDKTDRLHILGDELGVADGVDRGAVQDDPIEVQHRFLQQARQNRKKRVVRPVLRLSRLLAV